MVGLLAKLGAVCFWQSTISVPKLVVAELLFCVTVCAVSLLPCVADCCCTYCMLARLKCCLNHIKGKIIMIIIDLGVTSPL